MISVITFLVNALCSFVSRWPRGFQLAVGNGLGLFWFYIVPIRRRTVIENMKKAFPGWPAGQVHRTARRNFQNYGCGFIEFFMIPKMDERLFNRLFVVEGFEHYEKAINQGRGLFFLTLHIGSWELMSATQYNLRIPLHVITKKFKSKGLNEVWVKLRMNRGIKLIAEEKSTFQILRAIRSNGAVGFILDQFMGPPVGTRVKFFGHETGAPAALALFADRTRAPVIPVYNVRLPDGRIKVVFEKEVTFMEQGGTDQNISFMTQVYTSKIEEIVKNYPEQWLWLHRRWKPFRD